MLIWVWGIMGIAVPSHTASTACSHVRPHPHVLSRQAWPTAECHFDRGVMRVRQLCNHPQLYLSTSTGNNIDAATPMAVDAPECDIPVCTDKTSRSAMRFAVVLFEWVRLSATFPSAQTRRARVPCVLLSFFIRVDVPECNKHREAQQAGPQHANM